jgi:cobalamin biosynthesis Mg chelatase CobN
MARCAVRDLVGMARRAVRDLVGMARCAVRDLVGMARRAVPVAERSVRRRNASKRALKTTLAMRASVFIPPVPGGDIAARCPYHMMSLPNKK